MRVPCVQPSDCTAGFTRSAGSQAIANNGATGQITGRMVMKLDPNKEHYDQEFGWVAHPDGAYGCRIDGLDKQLVDHRYELDILGGVTDDEASYSYDNWALVRWKGDLYLFRTSGCSCPSPTETWVVEIGPATKEEIKAKLQSGDYAGYTMPNRQMKDFMELLDKA